MISSLLLLFIYLFIYLMYRIVHEVHKKTRVNYTTYYKIITNLRMQVNVTFGMSMKVD